MYAITLQNTAGQSLWRNDHSIEFDRPVLVYSHWERKWLFISLGSGKQSLHLTDAA